MYIRGVQRSFRILIGLHVAQMQPISAAYSCGWHRFDLPASVSMEKQRRSCDAQLRYVCGELAERMDNTPITHTPEARAQESNALLQDAGAAASSQTSIKPSNNAKAADKPSMAGAQLHAIGSIADISANWSAKVVVASEEQASRLAQ